MHIESRFLQLPAALRVVLLALALAMAGCAQQPIRDVTAVVGQVPAGSFFENLALGPDDAFYITDYTQRKIMRFTEAGGLVEHFRIDNHPLGIEFDSDGAMYFTAQEKNMFGGGGDFTNANWIYRALPGQPPAKFLQVTGANFLNGMIRQSPGQILIADSRGGTIWKLDTRLATASRFFVDPRLDANNPKAPTPGANGLKLRNGSLYISNTETAVIYALRLSDQGAPLNLDVFANGIRADDFAFSPEGTFFYTTHRDVLMKLDADGKPQKVAGAEAGVNGNTALAWNRQGRGPYVITDGGFVANRSYGGPAPGPATIVRLGSLPN